MELHLLMDFGNPKQIQKSFPRFSTSPDDNARIWQLISILLFIINKQNIISNLVNME